MAFLGTPIPNNRKTHVCRNCKKRKPLHLFNSRQQDRLLKGRVGECLKCDLVKQRKYRNRMGESLNAIRRLRYKANPLKHKNSELKKLYGITLDEFYAMLKSQGNKCAICGDTKEKINEGKRFNFQVDHCHKTGRIRGILCFMCNNALGKWRDSVEILTSAIAYINNSNGKKF